MITVRNINGTPESKPNTKFGVFSDENSFYFFESDRERIDFIEALPKQEIVQTERFVANWKVKAVLKSMDLLTTIENALNSLSEPTKTIAGYAWEYSNEINQFSPTVQLIKQACNLTDEQVQNIFDTADAINI